MAREDRVSAEARFHKMIRKEQEAKQAVSQYEADAAAVRAKTARLRELRLAKEAAEAKRRQRKSQTSRSKGLWPKIRQARRPRKMPSGTYVRNQPSSPLSQTMVQCKQTSSILKLPSVR